MDNTAEFYSRFKKKIEQSTSFPEMYLYKFIFEDDNKKSTAIQKVFDEMNPIISSKTSKNGKYISISIQIHAINPDIVIEKYKEVGKIQGVIML